MKEKDIDDLIDAYLKKRLSPEDQFRLDGLEREDPAFKKLISDCEETYRFLQYSRHSQLRAKFREIDKREVSSGSSFRKYLLVLSFFIILCSMCYLNLIHSLNPERLAEKYFIPIPSNSFENTLVNDEIIYLRNAEKLFIQGDFENAALLYQPTTLINGQLRFDVQWNIMMCRLAIEGPNDQWKTELKRLMNVLPPTLQQKCKRLLQLLDSPLYRWAIFFRATRFSAIKPRLI